MDAANIMKPALARGNLSCIGATTIAEYRRYIEPDPALERRFEKVIVNEPSSDETMAILRGMRPKWEEHHRARRARKSKGKRQTSKVKMARAGICPERRTRNRSDREHLREDDDAVAL